MCPAGIPEPSCILKSKLRGGCTNQENRAVLKNNGNFPGTCRMAGTAILACGARFKNFFKKSKKHVDPARAPGVQRQIPDAWASRSVSPRAQQHHWGQFVGPWPGPSRVLPWGCQGLPLPPINPPLSVAGTTCRVEVHAVAFGPSLSDSWQRFQPLVPAFS